MIDNKFELVTVNETMTRLGLDLGNTDIENDVRGRVAAIKGYLAYATGIKECEYEFMDSETQALAKEYILMQLYYDYYPQDFTEIAKLRLTAMIKQLQLIAL